MKRLACCAFFAASAAVSTLLADAAETATPVRVDVTAAVRTAGDGLATVTANVTAHSPYEIAKAFDGSASDKESDRFLSDWYQNSKDGPVMTAYAADGVEIVYEISDGYESGKDVVVDGYSILTVADATHAFNRLPGSWKFQAYDAATSAWVTLDERTAYVGWLEGGLTYDSTTQSGARFRFANAKSYRKYRFVITASRWQTAGVWTDEDAKSSNKGALQFSEIQLFGYVGEGIAGTVNAGLLDLTAFARESGDEFRTISSNLKENTTIGTLDNLFDGVAANRFFSNYTDSVKPAYEAGGAWIEYDFGEALASNADVVVTGYAIAVCTNTSPIFSHARKRMPCDWAFQGYDAEANEWKTLDAYHDFTCWETVDVSGTPCLGFRFDFPNAAAYRQYRLLVTRQYLNREGRDPASNNIGAIQLSEVQLFGYVGEGIAGTVKPAATAHPLKLADWANVQDAEIDGAVLATAFFPVLSASACSPYSTTSVTNLFNILRHDRLLCTPSEMPFEVSYEIPADMFLADKDMVLTNYVLEVTANWANYQTCVPKTWSLEAFADDRWIALDRRSEATWETEPFTYGTTDYTAYRAAFEIAEGKRFSATKYRLRVKSLAGASDFQLSEVTFNGVWGTGIANPPPERKGFAIIVR